jgi:WD40 repeat protein
VRLLALSRNGECLASASVDGDAATWNVARGTVTALFSATVTDLRFDPGHERLLVSGETSGFGCVGIVEDGTTIETFDVGSRFPGDAFSVAPVSTSLLLVGCADRRVYSIDRTNRTRGTPLYPFSAEAFCANRILVDGNGEKAAFKTSDTSIGVFSLTREAPLFEASCRRGRMTAAFSPSGKEIACVSSDGFAIQVLDARTGLPQRTDLRISGKRYIESIWYTGRTVVALLGDGTLWSFDEETDAQEEHPLGLGQLNPWPRKPYVSAVASTPDGRIFAVALGGEIRVFETKTGRERVFPR